MSEIPPCHHEVYPMGTQVYLVEAAGRERSQSPMPPPRDRASLKGELCVFGQGQMVKVGAWGGPYGQRQGFLCAKKLHGNSPHGLALFL